MYSGIIANTVAVIRGSYNGLPSTSTCQLTTCHRRCEVETKAASTSSTSIAHLCIFVLDSSDVCIAHLCIFVLNSSDVCIVEQRREAGAFLRGVPTNKQQSHPLWRLAQSWGTLFKKVNRVYFLDDEFSSWFCISSCYEFIESKLIGTLCSWTNWFHLCFLNKSTTSQ